MNDAVLREHHALRSVDHLLARLAGARIFSKLDYNAGFHQIPLTPESARLTTSTTPFGRFCYTRLPMGLNSASEVFQKRMCHLLDGIEGVLCLIDDILIFVKNKSEHDERLNAILQRLRAGRVTLNDKSEFYKTQIKFVGHIISADGISPDPDKVTAVTKMREPADISQLRCFLGMANQLAKFSSQLTDLSTPLRDLLRKNTQWTWDTPHKQAFADIKAALCTASVLALYDPAKPTLVAADASSYGLGSVLSQRQSDDSWRPVCFASRSLTDVERRYAQIEKECLALTWACEKFADFLVGIYFTLHTDHKPLISLLSSNKALDDVPPRIQRLRIRLMRFYFNITFVPGIKLNTADALSRLPLDNQPVLIDSSDVIEHYVSAVTDALPLKDVAIEKIKTAMTADATLKLVAKYCANTWPSIKNLSVEIIPYWHSRDALTVKDDIIFYNARLVIPSSLRQYTLESLHVGHLGIAKCRAKARTAVWWPKISSDIERQVASCQVCRHHAIVALEPLLPTPLPDLPWQIVAMDLFEHSNKHYIIIVDYFSRYIELIELRSQTAESVINAIKSVFARHGIPSVCVSDNGPWFAASQFRLFATEYGFQHRTSSPSFAQSNGEAERAVRTAKSMLDKSADIFLAFLSHRTSPLKNGFSPAQLLMGRQLRSTVPSSPTILHPCIPDLDSMRAADERAKLRQKENFDKRHRVRLLPIRTQGEEVYITDLKTNAIIIKSLDHRDYLLRTNSGTVVRRNGRLLRVPSPSTSPPSAHVTSQPNSTTWHLKEDACTSPRDTANQHHYRLDIHQPNALYVTKSGRVSKPPQRLKL